MPAAWTVARAQLRRRVAASIALVVLAGMAGGMVLTAVAGARRTSSALPRFLRYNDHPRIGVDIGGDEGRDSDAAGERAALQRLPSVRAAARTTALIMAG